MLSMFRSKWRLGLLALILCASCLLDFRIRSCPILSQIDQLELCVYSLDQVLFIGAIVRLLRVWANPKKLLGALEVGNLAGLRVTEKMAMV